VVVTETLRNAQRIVALEPGAQAHGLAQDQKLGDARALIPDLDAVPADRGADAKLLDQIAAWCDRYTPIVGLSGADGLMLDITGCAHLFGGERAMACDIDTRLRSAGLHPRTGLGDTPAAAWALARFAASPDTAAPAPPGCAEPGDRDALMALPLAALRLDPDMVTGLGRLGFRTVGCIAGLPRAPLTRRFGAALMTRLDQLLGHGRESIQPVRRASDLTAEKAFFDPITHDTDIARSIALLAEALVPMLEARGMGARGLELRLFRVDGQVQTLDVAAADALRDPRRISALFRERIAGLRSDIDAGFGFDLVKLAVTRADPFSCAQADLMRPARSEDSYRALVDRLGARLGTDRVRRFVGADTHIPERSFATLPVARTGATALQRDLGRMVSAATSPMGTVPVPPLTRPLWLLRQPERIEAMAGVPDDPPQRFRWRRVACEVTRSEGPERIACEWWRDGRATRTRDYYRVETCGGHRFWMFRNGLFGRETEAPDWYMHGLFA